jgi:lipoate-protein ligase A
MILWLDGPHGARENMARDSALLARAENGAEPVLRLFAFDPPGITLGYRQSPERELDLVACRRDAVEWAVRPTGGRAIFHAEEWTYALAAPLDHPRWGGTLAGSYDRVARLLVASLRALGVPAALGSARRVAFEDAKGHGVSLPAEPCFASTARHEVVLEGRKLVGSAQRRTARALLQQGSVLLGHGHRRLPRYLRLPEARRRGWEALLAAASQPAGEYLKGRSLADWAGELSRAAGPGVTTVRGEAGLFLLTLRNGRSYTPSASPESPDDLNARREV